MPWFKKNPISVEAHQLTNSNVDDIARWCNATVSYDKETEIVNLNIETLEGTMRVDVGSWVIKGVNGEFYPCRGDIFQQTYRQVGS